MLSKALKELERAKDTISTLQGQKSDLESEVLKAQMADWRESLKVSALKRPLTN